MDVEAAAMIAKGLLSIGFIGAGLGEGILYGMALSAMARNPQIADTIFTRAIIGMALTESVAIYTLVMFFLI